MLDPLFPVHLEILVPEQVAELQALAAKYNEWQQAQPTLGGGNPATPGMARPGGLFASMIAPVPMPATQAAATAGATMQLELSAKINEYTNNAEINFCKIHPHASRHVQGPSPSVAPPKADVGTKPLLGPQMGLLAQNLLGFNLPAQQANEPGDRSASYPVSIRYDFPTRFRLTQDEKYADMIAEDEYGNPIYCAHAGSWAIKKKFKLYDLRTGKKVGKLVSDVQITSGVRTDTMIDDVEYTLHLSKDENSEELTEKYKIVKHSRATTTAYGQFVMDIKHGDDTLSIHSPIGDTVAFIRPPISVVHQDHVVCSFSHSHSNLLLMNMPNAPPDMYYVIVQPGMDIRVALSLAVVFDKITTLN